MVRPGALLLTAIFPLALASPVGAATDGALRGVDTSTGRVLRYDDDATEAFFEIKGILAAWLAFLPNYRASLSPPDLLPAARLAPLASVLPPGPGFWLPRLRAPPLA